jgi:hypothetical protein
VAAPKVFAVVSFETRPHHQKFGTVRSVRVTTVRPSGDIGPDERVYEITPDGQARSDWHSAERYPRVVGVDELIRT